MGDLQVRDRLAVALGQRRLDERLLEPVADVQVGVVPQNGRPRVVDAGLARDQIGEAR